MHVRLAQRRRSFIAELCHHKPFPVFGPWHAATAVSRCRNRLMRHSSGADNPRRPCMVFQQLAHFTAGFRGTFVYRVGTISIYTQLLEYGSKSSAYDSVRTSPCPSSTGCWMREITKILGEMRVAVCVSAGLVKAFVPLDGNDNLRESRKAATS